MKQVKFRKRFKDRVSALTTVVYPAGWQGKVADIVATEAKKVGALAK